MKDNEQDSEHIKTTFNELLTSKEEEGDGEGEGDGSGIKIFWSQWSIDPDHLLIKDECLNNSGAFILDDLFWCIDIELVLT